MSTASAFLSSAFMTLLSEFGDKTFFVAAILSSRDPKNIVNIYLACWSSLAFMTVLSGSFGQVVKLFNHILFFIPHYFPRLIAAILLIWFGVEMIKEGLETDSENENEVEAEEQIKNTKVTDTQLDSTVGVLIDMLNAHLNINVDRQKLYMFFKIFATNILAEMGDKSQFTTVAVSSASVSALAVILGGVIGHAMCTGIAVSFGKTVSQKVSEETLNLIGGTFFILFAFQSLFSLM